MQSKTDCFWFEYTEDFHATIPECTFDGIPYSCPCYKSPHECPYGQYITTEEVKQFVKEHIDTINNRGGS